MSNKYTPSFMRDTSTTTATATATNACSNTNELPWATATTKSTSRYANYTTNTANATNATNTTATDAPTYQSRFAGGGVVNKNKFSTLSDDYSPMPSLAKSSVAPLVSGTLASLTSSATLANTGEKKSYASKFSEQAKADKYSPSKPLVIQKRIDVTSESEFPSLGLPSTTIPKNNSSTSLASNKSASSATSVISGNKFADLAKSWAQKTQDEQEIAALEAELKLKEKEDNELFRRMVKVPGFKHKKVEQYVSPDDIEEDEYNRYGRDDYLGNDEYDDIVPSGEEESTGDEFEDEDNLENEGQCDDYWR